MLSIKKFYIHESKWGAKCPYRLKPKYIIIHNSNNIAPAINEAVYMTQQNTYPSFHFAVDEFEAIQTIPLDRNSWNAGDGARGLGNRRGISIVICRSKSSIELFRRAEQNGAKLTAILLKHFGMDIESVKKHEDFSPKYCPKRTMDLDWKRFLDLVESYMNDSEPDVYVREASTYCHVRVEVAMIRVREKSSMNSKVIAKVYRGNIYAISKIVGNWGKLRDYPGWLYMSYALPINLVPVTQDTVLGSTIIITGNYYSDGSPVKDWEKRNTYRVKRLQKDLVLLSDVEKWIKNTSVMTCLDEGFFNSGDRVEIIGDRYVSGHSVAKWFRETPLTIREVKDNRAFLEEVRNWVYLKDLRRV